MCKNLISLTEPMNKSNLYNQMTSSWYAQHEFMLRRYPRLIRAMKWVAILADTEAGAALRDYVLGREGVWPEGMRYGGGEAVCHFGGPLRVIQRAIETRRVSRGRR